MPGFSNGICDCCSIKDCGPLCCINQYCCASCIWGDAMAKADEGNCPLCCLAISCGEIAPCVVLFKGLDIAKKYNVDEPAFNACIKAACCMPCYIFQIENEIMVRENLTWDCGSLKKDPSAAV
uniref:Uncharacterized protein n=1 Tax=Haptolina brevifila TaxID=156173 RepID=A0A7S2FW94_9EUKA